MVFWETYISKWDEFGDGLVGNEGVLSGSLLGGQRKKRGRGDVGKKSYLIKFKRVRERISIKGKTKRPKGGSQFVALETNRDGKTEKKGVTRKGGIYRHESWGIFSVVFQITKAEKGRGKKSSANTAPSKEVCMKWKRN